MFDTIAGLPLHPLVVHATEVIVPAAALALVLAALWPRFRRWAGWAPLGLGVASLVLVLLSTQSGEALEERVNETSAVERHVNMGEGLEVWVIGLVLVSAAMFALDRRRRNEARTAEASTPAEGTAGVVGALRRPASARLIAVVFAVAAISVGTGTIVQAILIGHSGATAVWAGTTGG
ncbi:DUF2231 domain-containing protein [Cellulomonas sp. KRMCY2]|uniref:DUF2231 domain-containing protein n=1 Tax=Cellulomonas sp. KRMCY2 TaxID=1304865 RepID=UPI00045EBFBB|nr:DUF2231 domain-containing protein [Cellulomonas sp. KRMCY2]